MLLVISRTVGSVAGLAAASVTALTTLTALSAAPAVAAAPHTTAPAVAAVPASAATPASVAAPPPVRHEDRAGGFGSRSGLGSGDRLTVTVEHAGQGHDGTYELACHPAAGSLPDPQGACAAVDKNTHWGSEPFAPVPEGSVCTMLYGGPATARVTGTWAGRPVDATYNRSNGCETARWNRMVPLLPGLGS
ncbi:SSI family serine proteinase inhibitor [Streptomyces sp. NPDC006012]|uniref:SSI family serine proteinase inhibitor n=1 Tax=Streptomyces sp. NPDC006012 TaxID=3364739 RepID=UPI0036B2073E